MKIVNDKLILEIPLTQEEEYTYGEGKYTVDTLCLVKWGDEYWLADLNYLDYKDDYQCGQLRIRLENEEEFDKLYKMYRFMRFYYNNCAECHKIMIGTYTINEKGAVCLEHEK